MGGPKWKVRLGRRSNVPGPPPVYLTSSLSFAAEGLSARDMTALSGAHTIGQAQCGTFRSHIYDDANVNSTFAGLRKRNCPPTGGDSNLAPLDLDPPNVFDDGCYRDLVAKKGLLYSEQELFDGGSQDSLVRRYSVDSAASARAFAAAMVKM
ncbi:peroxidase P7-like [Musa acuminata AAA Group]|uniref:peroxidase P7-like n=1 Tax=Musa acuminata AAA Group TaxID=214697 RepID=UPI0031DA6EB9